MNEIKSLDDALQVFSADIETGLRVEKKDVVFKHKLHYYEAEFYSGHERYGVLVVAFRDDVLESAAYRGMHPLRAPNHVGLILNRMDSEVLPFRRLPEPRYGRYDSNSCAFLSFPPQTQETVPRVAGAADIYLSKKFEMETVL